jgi:hypothetical protein
MIPERTNKKFNIANTRATSETVIFDGFFSSLPFFMLPPPSPLPEINHLTNCFFFSYLLYLKYRHCHAEYIKKGDYWYV